MKITIDIDLSLDGVKEFGKKIANSKQANALKQAFVNTYEACVDTDTRKFSPEKCKTSVKNTAKKVAANEKVQNAKASAVKYAGVARDKATVVANKAKETAVKYAGAAREKIEKGASSAALRAGTGHRQWNADS